MSACKHGPDVQFVHPAINAATGSVKVDLRFENIPCLSPPNILAENTVKNLKKKSLTVNHIV